MKLFRTLTLATIALTFALGTAFAQTTTPPPAAKPATTKATTTAPARQPAVKVTPVALKDLPASVTDAIKTAYPKGTITKANKTGADKDLLYAVTVKDTKATTVVKVSADGKIQTKK